MAIKNLLSFISSEIPVAQLVKGYDVKRNAVHSTFANKIESSLNLDDKRLLAEEWLKDKDLSTIKNRLTSMLDKLKDSQIESATIEAVDEKGLLNLALDGVIATSLLGRSHISELSQLSEGVEKLLTHIEKSKLKDSPDKIRIKLVLPSFIENAIDQAKNPKENTKVDNVNPKNFTQVTLNDKIQKVEESIVDLKIQQKKYTELVQPLQETYNEDLNIYYDYWENKSDESESKYRKLLKKEANDIEPPEPVPLADKQREIFKTIGSETKDLLELLEVNVDNTEAPLEEAISQLVMVKQQMKNKRLTQSFAMQQVRTVFYNGIRQPSLSDHNIASVIELEIENSELSEPPPPPYPIIQLIKGIHWTIESELKCYKSTEIAKITNVLKGELYQNTDRINRERVVTNEQFEENTSSRQEENNSSESNEMNRETQESTAFKTGADLMFRVSGDIVGVGEFSTEASAFLNVSTEKSTEQSSKFAQDYSKKLIEESQKIERSTKTEKNTFSTERVIRSALDNSEGKENITGIYRHVEKIDKVSLLRHEQKYMLEFMIPDPAKYIRSQLGKSLGVAVDINPVIDPAELEGPILSAADINEDNYLALAAQYQVNVDMPPPIQQTLLHTFAIDAPTGGSDTSANAFDIPPLQIPAGYKLYSWKVTLGFLQNGSETARIRFAFHGVRAWFDSNDTQSGFFQNDKLTNSMPIAVSTFFGQKNITGTCGLVFRLLRTDSLLLEWQQNVYSAIIDGYRAKLARYNDALDLAEIEARSTIINPMSPVQNRIIEHQELQKSAISMMTGVNMSGFDDTDEPYKIKLNEFTKEHGQLILFLQTAFEWPLMNWLHYPYFWKKEAEWKPLSQDAGHDPVHQAFLNAGYARCLVAIRPGYEKAALHFLQTGEPWLGEGLADEIDLDSLPVDEKYLPLWEEIMNQQGEASTDPESIKDWENKIPTNLLYLQKNSQLDVCPEDIVAANELIEADPDDPVGSVDSDE